MFWTRCACTCQFSRQFECLWKSPCKHTLNTGKKSWKHRVKCFSLLHKSCTIWVLYVKFRLSLISQIGHFYLFGNLHPWVWKKFCRTECRRENMEPFTYRKSIWFCLRSQFSMQYYYGKVVSSAWTAQK